MSRRQPKQQSKTGLGAKELYLVGYNLASAGAWAYILLLCVQHLRQPPPPVSALPSSTFSSSTKMLLLSSSAYASLGKQVSPLCVPPAPRAAAAAAAVRSERLTSADILESGHMGADRCHL